MTDCETHENEERTVICPVEGCDAEKLARGMHLHVLHSKGDGQALKASYQMTYRWRICSQSAPRRSR